MVKINKGTFIYLATIIILIMFMPSIYRNRTKVKLYKLKKDRIKSENKKLQGKINDIKKYTINLNNVKFIEEEARKSLNMVKKKEKIFKIMSDEKIEK